MVGNRKIPVDAAGAGAGGIVQRGRERRREIGLRRRRNAPAPTSTSSVTATVWVSLVSASVKSSVPAGTVGVVSIAAEPVVSASSDTVADSGPLVMTTG